jgi:hypothetical protein
MKQAGGGDGISYDKIQKKSRVRDRTKKLGKKRDDAIFKLVFAANGRNVLCEI